MKPQSCECESTVVTALQRGALPEELRRHAAECPVCSEVLVVAESLRAEAEALGQDESSVPGAGIVWQKAQARLREEAMARATLPIRIMRTGALAVAILASPWLVLQFPHPFAGMPAWLHVPSLQTGSTWLGTLTGTTLVGIVATFVCIGLSSWYMLREE